MPSPGITGPDKLSYGTYRQLLVLTEGRKQDNLKQFSRFKNNFGGSARNGAKQTVLSLKCNLFAPAGLFVGIAGFLVGTGSVAWADTVTDTTLDVSYTATSTFVAGPGNVYDVFLTVDATHFNGGSGFLDAVAMQFKTGSDISSHVALLAAPGGTADWSSEMPGGISSSSGGCNGSGVNGGDVCFQNLTANDFVPATGPYTFEFAVTMPNNDALTAASDIKDSFRTTISGSNRNLGQTSMPITIQPQATTPEPATFALIGLGLVAAGCGRKLLARAKRQ